MATIYRRRPYRRLSQRRFPVYSKATSTETIPVTNAALTLAGQTVNVLETELVAVTNAALTLAGQTVGVLDAEVVPVTHASITLAGQTVDLVEISADVIPVDSASLTLAGQDIGVVETAPVGGTMAGGGGGPSSDEAYEGTRRREQAKRDAERRLWKGEPKPDTAPSSKPPARPAEVKEPSTPEPEAVDALAELLALIAQPDPLLLMQPRPSRVFDPEDDVAVLLLTDL